MTKTAAGRRGAMRVRANGIEIEVEDSGPVDGRPLLLVMGLGMQLTAWPIELVELLHARGFRVIRFDNRDIGLSQGFDHLGVPSIPFAALRHMVNLPVHAPYSVGDMAADALGVLDALRVEAAHVCGVSLGGMIAQHMAARAPRRVASLTLVMTTTGARRLPRPTPRAQLALMSRARSDDREAAVEHMMRVLRAIGSPAWPAPPALFRARVAESVARSWRPAGSARQLLAVAADGDRTALVRRLAVPAHVIHGIDDPLVPVMHGHHLQAELAGATADYVPGMGHDLPLPLLERFADGIAANAGRSSL